MDIIFASSNKGKILEVKKIFDGSIFNIISLYDLSGVPEIEETGDTFKENSLLKAKTIYEMHNKPAIADDSGLEIFQLGNKPGVYSARYAGENCSYDDNNNLVINQLQKFPEPHKARFVSCAVYFDGSSEFHFEGFLNGRIIKSPRGTNGFGYDPIFIPDGYDVTLAEMTVEAKNKLSHRAIAFNGLKQKLLKLL